MTLAQTLERLAVVAPEWMRFDEEAYMYFIKGWDFSIWVGTPSKHNYPVLGNKEDRALLFGACCEKIESEGWTHSHVRSVAGEFVFEVHDSNSGDDLSREESEESLAHAAAAALLTALEGWVEKKCPECKGIGHVNYKQCKTCEGKKWVANTTGKQSED